MDLNTVTEVVHTPPEMPGAVWRNGDAWLAGGTWLFSVPQPSLTRLVDLTTLGWEPLTITADGLQIGATCTIHDLYAFSPPAEWEAASLIGECCRAFLSSFKVWNSATVGGNICMSLPAGPMISLTVALEATYTVWSSDGSIRQVDAADFVTGDNANILEPGDILRSVDVPAAALRRRAAFRKLSLTHLGRSTALLIGTLDPVGGDLLLTVSAATVHPVRLRFDAIPDARALHEHLLAAIPYETYFDDPNGTPDHRKHLTHHFAEQIRVELAASSGQEQP